MKATVTALVLALAFVGAENAAAASITINTVPGTIYTTTGIDDFPGNDSQLGGMQVTAYWTVNGIEKTPNTQTWNGSVNFADGDFIMSVNGNTLHTAWDLDFQLSGGLLQKLVFNGILGRTVFDQTVDGEVGTAGSGLGRDLEGFDGYDGSIVATYFNPVALGTDAPVGDLFAGLEIEFLGGGLGENDKNKKWSFSVDTDTTTTRLEGSSGTLETMPEPASMVLFGTGLLGLAALARRRARQS